MEDINSRGDYTVLSSRASFMAKNQDQEHSLSTIEIHNLPGNNEDISLKKVFCPNVFEFYFFSNSLLG